MCKKISIIALCFLLIVIGCFAGCGSGGDEDPIFVRANTLVNGIAYKNVYIYRRNNSTAEYFQLLNNLQPEGLPLYSDALAEGTENPFNANNIILNRLMVDPIQTEKNGGTPVIIGCGIYYVRVEGELIPLMYDRIISYNVVTNEMKVIQEQIPNSISQMFLYGNTVYYVTNDGDAGSTIHRIDADGQNYLSMENPDALRYSVETIYADRVYYTSPEGLHSCTLTFEDHKLHTSAAGRSKVGIFCNGDYIYYTNHSKEYPFEGGKYPAVGESLCRISISGNGEEEILFDGIHGGMNCNGMLYYVSAKNAEAPYDMGYNVLYEYNTETGETREIFDVSEEEYDLYLQIATEDYLICNKLNLAAGESSMCVVDLETLEVTSIPQ